jgi:transposase
MRVSEVTFLRLIRQQLLATAPTPRVLGVDDWAIRKGERYGTILVDLEAHRPIDLLPDREADSLANWLRAHSGVEIISRDRGTPYIDGATKGAPQALQVADRWHLLHNLREAVQEILEPLRAQLTITGEQPVMPESPAASAALPKKRAWAYNRQERHARYQKMVDLAGQGLTNQAIARAVGVSITTVRNYLAAGQFPEWQPRPIVSKWLSPYLPYLQQRWDEGCHNSAQLWRELCQQGYCRSRTLVYEYIARLRYGLPTSPSSIGACSWPARSSKTSLAPGKRRRPLCPLSRPVASNAPGLPYPVAPHRYTCPPAQHSRKLPRPCSWL